jgi:hypothetical protein
MFPCASDVMTPGHSIWIAIPATIPAMFGGSPVFPESCEVIDAMVAPGFTSDGQMDWPIPAILSVKDPLVPVPAPFSAALIGSVVGSACARAGNAAPAAMMPAATASGRSAAEAALVKPVVHGRYIVSAGMQYSSVRGGVHRVVHASHFGKDRESVTKRGGVDAEQAVGTDRIGAVRSPAAVSSTIGAEQGFPYRRHSLTAPTHKERAAVGLLRFHEP